MPADNVLAFTIALQGYTSTLLELVRIVTGKKKREIADLCAVAPSLVGQWLRGACPLAPQHEKALRVLLVDASRTKRAAVAAMGAGEQRRLQRALLGALTALDAAYIALSGE